MGGNNEFFENFERNKYLNKLPSMQRVKSKAEVDRAYGWSTFSWMGRLCADES